MPKPILLLDFDGVLHSYSSGWKGISKIPDPPVPGALEFIIRALQEFEVNIYSSRSKSIFGRRAMRRWFEKHAAAGVYHLVTVPGVFEALEWEPGIDPDEEWYFGRKFCAALKFPNKKPGAFLTIDDRAVCFDGDFSALDPKELRKFQPWNKR